MATTLLLTMVMVAPNNSLCQAVRRFPILVKLLQEAISHCHGLPDQAPISALSMSDLTMASRFIMARILIPVSKKNSLSIVQLPLHLTPLLHLLSQKKEVQWWVRVPTMVARPSLLVPFPMMAMLSVIGLKTGQ